MDNKEKEQLVILVKTLQNALEQLYLNYLRNDDIETTVAAKKVADDCIRDIYDLLNIRDYQIPQKGKSKKNKKQNLIHPDYIRLKKVCAKCGRVFMPRKNLKSQICWKCRRKKSL